MTTILVVNAASPVFAHKERIHQKVTDEDAHDIVTYLEPLGPDRMGK
jgi:hypothetical protein